jgi:hypothetical protein
MAAKEHAPATSYVGRALSSVKNSPEVQPVNRLSRFKRQVWLSLAISAAVLLCAGGASSASLPAGIEGVWSFNGGKIAIQRLSTGSYAGTVVAETTFAACTHPVGQQIWTGMTEQSDGSYWGLHQWYLTDCKENPERGPTAWRVLEGAKGSHYMRVCFSHPGTSQPTIAADGAPKEESEYAAHGVTYGCDDSALIAPLPVASGSPETTGTPGTSGTPGGKAGAIGAIESLSLPSTKQCLSVKLLKIRLKDPRYDPFKTVTITFKGHKLATSRKGSFVIATINLKSVRKGTFTIDVHATTVLGHTLSAKRTYHRCVKKVKPKKSGKKG